MSQEKPNGHNQHYLAINWARFAWVLAALPIGVTLRLQQSVNSVWLWPAALMTSGIVIASRNVFTQTVATESPAQIEKTQYFIVPKQFHPRFCLHENWDPKIIAHFFRQRLGELQIVEINSCIPDPNDCKSLLIDGEKFRQQLPEFTQRTLVIVTVPSPVGTRDRFGVLGIHAVTIFIEPVRRKIRVNEPMCKNMLADGSVVKFPHILLQILEYKYRNYTVICEHKQLQLRGEKICQFLAYKMGQYYQQGNIEALTREQVMNDWPEDMKLLQSTAGDRNNLYYMVAHLLMHIGQKIAADFVPTTKNLPFCAWTLSNTICLHITDSNIANTIHALSQYYIYYDAYTEANYLSELGEAFVDEVYRLISPYTQFKTLYKDEQRVQELVRFFTQDPALMSQMRVGHG